MEKQAINAPGLDAVTSPRTRKEILKLAALGLGAAAGAGLLPGRASAQAGGDVSDVKLLNFLYVNEAFEANAFYPAALDAGILSGEALAVISQIQEIEVVHRDAVASAVKSLGGTLAPLPQFVVPDSILASQQVFLEAALKQETKDVGLNLGAAPMIRNRDILAAAAAISGTEGENLVAVKNLLGIVPPANQAFPAALTQDQVLAILAPFLGMGGMLDTGGETDGSTARAL